MAIEGVQMVGLYVTDFEASLRFYRDILGIPLKVDAHGDYHHAEISFADPYFHFAIFPSRPPGPPSPTHVTFVVADLNALLQRLSAHGQTATQPRTIAYSGGGRVAEVFDPDGNEVELFEPAREG